jgi:hypothetical protein
MFRSYDHLQEEIIDTIFSHIILPGSGFPSNATLVLINY